MPLMPDQLVGQAADSAGLARELSATVWIQARAAKNLHPGCPISKIFGFVLIPRLRLISHGLKLPPRVGQLDPAVRLFRKGDHCHKPSLLTGAKMSKSSVAGELTPGSIKIRQVRGPAFDFLAQRLQCVQPFRPSIVQ